MNQFTSPIRRIGQVSCFHDSTADNQTNDANNVEYLVDIADELLGMNVQSLSPTLSHPHRSLVPPVTLHAAGNVFPFYINFWREDGSNAS